MSKPELERAVSLGAGCEQCPLADKDGPVYFKPKSSNPIYDFDITIVAERPGDTELGKGEPLAGRSGWLLQKLLKELHISWPQVHATNATLCTSSKIIQEREWSAAVNCCRPRLANELSSNKKQLVFLLGKRSLQSVTGKDSIKAWRGFPLEPLEIFDRGSTVYIPTYHPAFILREAAFASVWKLDFQRAIAYMQGSLKPVAWPQTFVEDDEQTMLALEGILKDIEKRPTWAGTDVETAGKEPLLVKMLCQAISTREQAVCLPRHSRFPEAFNIWKRLLEHKNCLLVAHNGLHDLLSYESNDIFMRLSYDTLIASRIAYPRLDHDLGSVASYHHFIPRHKAIYRKGDSDTKGESAWEKASRDPLKFRAMRTYCARDAFTTLICKEPLERMLG